MQSFVLSESKLVVLTDDTITIASHDKNTHETNSIVLDLKESLEFVKALCDYAGHPVGCVNPDLYEGKCGRGCYD